MSDQVPTLNFEKLKQDLLAEGFFAVGAFDFSLVESELRFHREQYQKWIAAGYHGSMAYLERGLERRFNPELVMPGAVSAVVVAQAYDPRPVEKDSIRYARYLNGPDYHVAIPEKLERVFKTIPEVKSKICVDTSAVLERAFGAIAGLGWIGKNTLLIHPQHGSYFFIGVVLTNAHTFRGSDLLKDYCGNCERCLNACPTQAFPAPHVLDSKKCISYLTLEHRGPVEPSPQTDGYLAGCDRCQEVCPFNTKSVRIADEVWGDFTVNASIELNQELLAQETEEAYRMRVRSSSLKRVKYADSRRNLAWTLQRSPQCGS